METPVAYRIAQAQPDRTNGAAPAANGNGHAAPFGTDANGVNDAGLPVAWVRLLYRLAGLERGRVYTLTLIVPEQAHAEPTWAIVVAGKLENVRA